MKLSKHFRIQVFIVILLCGFTQLSATKLTLSLSHVDKEASNQSFITNTTNPFVINVTSSEMGRNSGSIEIKGLNNFHILGQNRSSSTQIINGQASSQMTHHITAQAIKEGTFEIGPAILNQNGTTITSNTVSLTIKTRHQSTHTKNKAASNTNNGSLIYKISVDKDHVVIGEPLVLTTTFYMQGNILEIASERPSLNDFTVKEITGSSIREEVIDGVNCRVEEKKTVLIPQQEGTYKIPSCKAQYSVPIKNKRRPGGFFDDDFMNAFFGQQAEQRLATSNDLTIHVQPVPEHDTTVDGIGDFVSFSATISKQSAQAHEPLALSLDLEGWGNFEHIAIPRLFIPHSIKYFESKNEFSEDLSAPYTQGKKHFEFILQATHAGNITIPEQKFTYYNTRQKKFITLTTKPIDLSITAPQNQPSSISEKHQPENINHDVNKDATDNTSNLLDVCYIQEDFGAEHDPSTGLPWWLFFIIALLAPLFINHSLISKYFFQQLITTHQSNKSRAILNKTFTFLIKRNDTHGLYQFFLQLLANRFAVDPNLVTEDWIEQTLKAAEWDASKIDDFLDFMGTCAQLHFSHHRIANEKIESLIKKAKYWHIMLNK